LNHRKKTKADGSRLIPRKDTETLVLLSVLRKDDKIPSLQRKDVLEDMYHVYAQQI